MNALRSKLAALWFVAVATAAAVPVQAAPVTYQVVLDTGALIGHTSAPFSLNFQLIDGGGGATNTVELSGFDFGVGGGGSGNPTRIGGASGDLAGGVTLTDAGASFLNLFIEGFVPGSRLSFTVVATTEVEPGGIPDQFSFGILDGNGLGLPTTFFDVIFSIDIDSPSPTVAVRGSDPSAGGPRFEPPAVQVVPEPGTAALLLAGALGLLGARTRGGLRAPHRSTGSP